MPGRQPDLPAGYRFRPEYETTVREAAEKLRGEGSFVVLDVREEAEVRAMPLEGSVHIPLGQLEARWEELEVGEDEWVGVVCAGGVRSLKAALFLQHVGLAGARSVAGGMELWARQAGTGSA